METDPPYLDIDAPTVNLLRLRDQNLIAEMDTETLTKRLIELRASAQQVAVMSGRLKRESNEVAAKVGGKVKGISAERQAKLNML